MALRTKIDKATFDTLPADVKKEYEQHGDDYILGVEDLDSLPAFVSARDNLKRAKDNEVGEHNKTKAKLTEAEATIADLQSKDSTRTNDTKAIEERWKKKVEDATAEGAAKVKAREDQLSGILVDAEAARIAGEISVEPEVILPHIRARLQADLTGEKPVTVVLGKDGQPSTMKTADLAKEFVADKKFSAIIKASNGSGSGAVQQQGSGSAATYKGKKFAELNDAERVAWHREDAAGFKAASDAHKQQQAYG